MKLNSGLSNQRDALMLYIPFQRPLIKKIHAYLNGDKLDSSIPFERNPKLRSNWLRLDLVIGQFPLILEKNDRTGVVELSEHSRVNRNLSLSRFVSILLAPHLLFIRHFIEILLDLLHRRCSTNPHGPVEERWISALHCVTLLYPM